MINFEVIFEDLKKKVLELAKDLLKENIIQAEKECEAFLDSLKEDVKIWTNALEEGKINQEEFEYLIKTQIQTFECMKLHQQGVAKVKIELFKNRLLDLLLNTIIDNLSFSIS
ncbi:MAG: hypothetical protein ABIN61_00795 [candidate division WOR-3 bacterium]